MQKKYVLAPIKSYSKSQVARMMGISTDTLRKYLMLNKELFNSLTQFGYNPYQKTLTPRQIELIFCFLGRPRILDLSFSVPSLNKTG
jgi:hypothetical protein